MKLNDRARRTVADDLEPDERIEAVVMLSNSISAMGATSDGVARSGGTVLGTSYARARGIDLTDRRLRIDLLSSWLTVTDRRLLFHSHRQLAIRPRPGELLWTCDRAGIVLHHFEADGLSLVTRVLHFEFPDDTHLLSATILRAGLRRKPFNDEPALLLSTFGQAAREVTEVG